ncbi:MAG: undecaprenyl-phosphate glucose phosphotransferase [Pseudomonadota bacterium]
MSTTATDAIAVERRSGRPRTARPTAPWLAVLALRWSEAAAVALAGWMAWWAHPALGAMTTLPLATVVVVTLAAAWMYQRLGAYHLSRVFTLRAGLERQQCAWVLTMAALVGCQLAYPRLADVYPRLWLASWLAFGLLLPALVRLAFATLTATWLRDGRLAQRTVVVGTTDHGQRLVRHLKSRDIRTRIIGFAYDQDRPQAAYLEQVRVLGNIEHLVRLIRRNEIDQVIIALPWAERDRIMRILDEIADTPVDIRLAPELLQFEFLQRQADMVGGVPLLRVVDRPVCGSAALLKAAEDHILGSLLLALCAPLMAVIAAAIKLDSRGPVFFRQTRYGFNNNLIRVWKFRTMYQHMTDANASVLTQRDDPRVTRVGRVLRRTSLDELPQLLNVITGEMSLVGPRPHALEAKAGDQIYEDVVRHYAARHRVKPGLTGWAQVNGWRGETDTPEKLARRVEHDLHYIEHWSLWLDLRILLRTARVVVGGENAF